jgi:hypothetical protein
MNRPSLDDVTRGHLLLAFGTVAGAFALVLVVAPGLVPGPLRAIQPSVEADGVFSVAVLLAVVLLLVAVFRVLSDSSTPLDRSPIREDSPERPTSTDSPSVGERAETAYDQLLQGFSVADRRRRYVAMYGRRARHVEHPPSGVQSLLDELAATAADVHATAARREEGAAHEAVDEGSWTDDRIAAAFLADDPDAVPSFTTRERLLGWIAPRHTFEARLDQVLDEIERQADSFLTYDARHVVDDQRENEGPRHDDERAEVTGAREVTER